MIKLLLSLNNCLLQCNTVKVKEEKLKISNAKIFILVNKKSMIMCKEGFASIE